MCADACMESNDCLAFGYHNTDGNMATDNCAITSVYEAYTMNLATAMNEEMEWFAVNQWVFIYSSQWIIEYLSLRVE